MSTSTRPVVIAGNWKMNGSQAMVQSLTQAMAAATLPDGVVTVVCPPSVYMSQVVDGLRGTTIHVGAQNMGVIPESGAYTGEISAAMLQDVGAHYVILGHSERREYYGETDEFIADKVKTALDAGLTPIVCVGETLAQREAGDMATIVLSQVEAVTNKVGVEGMKRTIVAYEPIWAIGTGVTATPEQAQEVHGLIRSQLSQSDEEMAAGCVILYGGSMKPDNAADLLGQPDIDGGLIGGASLEADAFLAIVDAGAKI